MNLQFLGRLGTYISVRDCYHVTQRLAGPPYSGPASPLFFFIYWPIYHSPASCPIAEATASKSQSSDHLGMHATALTTFVSHRDSFYV